MYTDGGSEDRSNLDDAWDADDAGDREASEAAFRRAMEADEPGAQRSFGHILFEWGRSSEAVPLLETGLADGDAECALPLGYALADLARIDEALVAYRVAADGGETSALIEIGTTQRDRGRFAEAESALREALEAGEEDAFVFLAQVLLLTDRSDEAMALLWEGAAREISTSELQLANELASEDRNHPEIEGLYRRALEHGELMAEHNLGRHLLELGDREYEGLRLLQQAAARGDELSKAALADESPLLLADVYQEWGETDLAEASLKLAVDRGEPDAAFALALLLDDAGRTAEALTAATKGIAAGDAECYCVAGWLHTELGQVDEAAASYQAAIAAGDDDDGGASCLLGDLLDEVGRTDEALPLWERALAGGFISSEELAERLEGE